MKRNRHIIQITKTYKIGNRPISFFYVFIIVVILVSLLCGMYAVSEIIGIKSAISNINDRIDNVESHINYPVKNNDENVLIEYYRELSDKTDAAIDRILAIVGMLAAIISFFGLLLTFRAPQNITNQINQVREVGEKASISAESAQYQLEIFTATNFDSNNNPSCFSKVDKLTKVINNYPDKPEAYVMRARVYEQLAQQFEQLNSSGQINDDSYEEFYRSAISDYSLAMALGADKGDCNNNIGIVYADELNQPDEAIKYFDKAINTNPEENLFYVNRGNCYEMLKNYSGALEDFGKAIDLDDKEAFTYYSRSIVYSHMRIDKQDDNSLEHYMKLEYADLQTAVDLDPTLDCAKLQLEELCKEARKKGVALE